MRYLLGLFLLSGCLAHHPASEALIFHEPRTSGPAHTRGVGAGLALVGQDYHRAARDLAREVRDHFSTDLAPRLGGGFYLVEYRPSKAFSYSATLGLFTGGIDATFRVRRSFYLTTAVSLPLQPQATLLFYGANTRDLGWAFGPSYRYMTVALSEACDVERQTASCFPGSRFSVPPSVDHSLHLWGLRNVLVLREQGTTDGGLRLSIHLGYSPRLDEMVASFGLGVGAF